MLREAFDIRKSFPGVPNISCAGWVGTIKHTTMDEDVERVEQTLVMWLDGCNCESERSMVHKKNQKTHASHQNNLKMW